MNEENLNPNDAKLSALLREARSAPSLRPRFQEGVWRRIEESEAPAVTSRGWLEALAAWALRPRFALVVGVVLVLAGSLFGVHAGSRAAQQEAQTRYVTAVAPNSLR